MSVQETTNSAGFPMRAYRHWSQLAHAIGVVQTRGLMIVVFVVMFLPMGLIQRLRQDPLHLKLPKAGNWTPIVSEPISIEKARQQG